MAATFLLHCWALGLSPQVVFAQDSALAPPGVSLPVLEKCGPSGSKVVCTNRYASVMPYHFYREGDTRNTSQGPLFRDTSVPSDPSFSLMKDADFVVFDKERGLPLLGSSPTYEYMFMVSGAVHEAPVYMPTVNKLFFATLAPPNGTLPNYLIDLNVEPPTLNEYLPDPPVYAPNGGTYYNGLVYLGASGAINDINGTGEQRISIRTLDPATNKTVTILDNYYGYYFNCIDDLFVDRKDGSIWFTDPQYSWFNRLADTAPQMQTATYRFDPATGETRIVEDSLGQPNGIDASIDGKYVYISDTEAYTGSVLQDGPVGYPWNQSLRRTVYKFDRTDDGMGITSKRPIYYSFDGAVDGLKVAANGMVVAGSAKSVDVMDSNGSLIMRVQTNFSVQNFAWTGKDLNEMWIVGQKGVARVRWNLTGHDLAAMPGHYEAVKGPVKKVSGAVREYGVNIVVLGMLVTVAVFYLW